MAHTLACVLLLLSSFLSYGHSQATLTADKTSVLTSDRVTLTCTVDSTASIYFYRGNKVLKVTDQSTYTFSPSSVSESGSYWCRGWIKDTEQFTQYSNTVHIAVSADRPQPKATLKADQTDIPVGGSVTLTCSVEGSSGWTYWYESLYQGTTMINQGPISVSKGGLYWCRGGRGEPVNYSQYSDAVTMNRIVGNRSVVVLQSSWPQIFSEETITLKCEIQGRGDTEWDYEWDTTSSFSDRPVNQAEFRINSVSKYHSGDYRCKGRPKDDLLSSTTWSDVVKLTVLDKPQSVLSVSPQWLSPEASVTLNCDVKESSAGWLFYWYRAVPKPTDWYNSYTYELLSGSHNGTVEGSYIIHGATGTGGYVCKAGRGEPVYYTMKSNLQFVWSGDLHSSASLTVSSNRTQHFTSESVSLSCEGNSTEWKVKTFRSLSQCSSSKVSMDRYTCNFGPYTLSSGVYWCESELGEYSNAVNITAHDGSVILVSPVHPVTEGHSVTLQCKHRTDTSLSNVDFYRNEELVQTKTNGEMVIPAVSKSDEGFYKCTYSGEESPRSWMTARLSGPAERSSPHVVGLIVGLLVVILLAIILLLLYRYRTLNEPCWDRFVKCQGTNQDSDQMTNQRGSADDGHSTLQHDEPTAGSSDAKCSKDKLMAKKNKDELAAESSDETYSQIELKHMGKKKKETPADPLESSLYSEVKTGSAREGTGEPDVTYAQVHHQNKGKAKKKRERPADPLESSLYSEVKTGSATDAHV